MNLTGRPVHQKDTRDRSPDPARKAAVAHLPCCICDFYGLVQLSRTTVHHCIMGRYDTRREPDSETIPLCDGHHQARFDASKIAIHREPKEWRAKYGPDTDWVKWTDERIDA